MKASIVDLRYRMKDVLRAIDRGEPVTVLYRGKERAKIVPIKAKSGAKGKDEKKRIEDEKKRMEQHPFFGMWADREDMKDPVAWVRKLREKKRFPDLGI